MPPALAVVPTGRIRQSDIISLVEQAADTVLTLTEQIAFRDRGRAHGHLARLAQEVPVGVQNRLQVLLGSAGDADGVLLFLTRLLEQQPGAFHRLSRSPAELQLLVTVFSHSHFLSESILQHPDWLDPLTTSGDLHRALSADEYRGRLEEMLAAAGSALPLALALFRRREVLRILVRDVLGFGPLSEITAEISALADAILEVACRRIRHDLAGRYGVPQCDGGGASPRPCGFSVVALGKLGGQELNYSSDIDLMFVYAASGETAGPETISNKEFFRKVANHLTDLLSTYTPEGMCYRVDLRLRPEGRLGEVCLSVEACRAYYRERARDWELQMLTKARVAAGDREPGGELLEFVEPLIYSSTLDFSAVEAVSEARERISDKLALKKERGAGFNVKLERGGIRDIEFLVQCLQRLHGGREPWVRHGGTMLALFRLRDKALLSDPEYSRLASAYQFLRHLEHRLQCVDDRQTHDLPASPEQLDLLARRMPAAEIGGAAPSAEKLLAQLNRHLEEVQEIYERVIHAQQPFYYTGGTEPVAAPPGVPFPEEEDRFVEPAASNLVRFLDQKAPGLAASLTRGGLRRGARAFEHFLERVLPNRTWLEWLDADDVLAGHVLDLFEHSPYFAEQLIRRPDWLAELQAMRNQPSPPPDYAAQAAELNDPVELRRFFNRAMLRIQSESVCLRAPIFDTLQRTSRLADSVIAASYRMAVDQVRCSHPPSAGYEPGDQMMVIALGRLGMQELDLGSDADLVFVLSDRDADEHMFWTRVAERMIDVLMSYTGEGVVFAIDTRLRPNGREGPLVQYENGFLEYFATRAEAWEGITYMKARAVAGNLTRGTGFLAAVQDVDWRRYGQGGRSRKELWQMRMRLEREQGPGNPLKAGYGGYYDIDFALMFLRLKGAGMFFVVLNTPERIDVIEKMGHLERQDADFLRDAATFYRGVDHGLRVISGHTEGSLPASPSQRDLLTGLVGRWTPERLHDQPLDVEIAQIQSRTREYFQRLFG